MIAYHGTTPESAEAILKNGFTLDHAGKNGDHFGRGVYLTTSKEEAARFGTVVLTVEFDSSSLHHKKIWLDYYNQKCNALFASGVPQILVTPVAGVEIQERHEKEGYKGLILDVPDTDFQEIVLYDPKLVTAVSR